MPPRRAAAPSAASTTATGRRGGPACGRRNGTHCLSYGPATPGTAAAAERTGALTRREARRSGKGGGAVPIWQLHAGRGGFVGHIRHTRS